MDDAARANLRTLAERNATNAVWALALVERAVADGRLNIAKVLRAHALGCQRRAQLVATASMDADVEWERVLAEMRAQMQAESDALVPLAAQSTAAAIARDGIASVARILDRTIDALSRGRDVGEDTVAQFLWGCETCGYIAEANRPELCPACGNIGGEFAMFAPFFSATREHIGRLAPDEALAQLRGDAARVADAMDGVSDADLRKKPAPGEWCMKEIAGHMIDIVEIALRAVRPSLDPSAETVAERSPLPWKLLDYEDYPEQTADAILNRFRSSTGELVALLEPLPPEAWRTSATLISGRTPLVDVLSWVANHNTAHTQQIIALRPASQA